MLPADRVCGLPLCERTAPAAAGTSQDRSSGQCRENLLVQAGCAGAVERQPAKQDDPWDGILAMDQAIAGQVVVHEALRQEPSQQSLDNAMVQVELDDAVVHALGSIKHHRADGGFFAPLEALLAVLGQRPEGIERDCPAGIAS